MNSKNVQKAMPMIMLAFILAGSLQEAFNVCAPLIAEDFAVSSSDVSLISAVAMLTMGVAYVVYTALSDFMSIKKLLIVGIIISAIGSIGGLLFNQSFMLVVIFRAVQMAGGTCSSALLILSATKYLDETQRMKYYGFNTACFSGGQMFGILLGGIFSAYLGWRYLFIVPVFSLICIPFIMKYLPEDSKEEKTKIDFLGITIMALLSLFISLYFNLMDVRILALSLVTAVIFLVYISRYKHAFITIDFFKNWKYMLVILVVLITYLTQGSYSFLFSFMAKNVHQIDVSQISMILLPSYAISMAIGIMGSKITKRIGLTKTLVMGLGSMALGLLLGSFFLESSIVLLVIMSCLFNGGFSILYTPIMTLVINALPEKMRGTGLGFFNLCIKITSSTGIVITGRLLTMDALQNTSFTGTASSAGMLYSNILLLFVIVVFISFITVNIVKKMLISESN
ncbi:MAG: MFS transporter [Longicatena sp.]